MIKKNYCKGHSKEDFFLPAIDPVPVQAGLALTGKEAYQRAMSGAPLPEGMDTLFNAKEVEAAGLPDYSPELSSELTSFEIMDKAIQNTAQANSILEKGKSALRRDLRKKTYELGKAAAAEAAAE